MEKENDISYFVKYNRNKIKMTQEDLAERAGVGLRFIRDLEQGKESLRIDKVNQVLALFGYKMVPGTKKILDPYEILIKHSNRAVHIFLKNRIEYYGIILEPVTEDQQIRAWKFVSNNNAIKFKETADQALVQKINHNDIEKIENV